MKTESSIATNVRTVVDRFAGSVELIEFSRERRLRLPAVSMPWPLLGISIKVKPSKLWGSHQNPANRAKNAQILALGRSTDTSHARDIEVSRMITFRYINY